jgi:hypothetical protein
MMTTISKLKLGDRLADTNPTEFGYYTNIIVVSIRQTKSGRYVIETESQFVYADGKISEPSKTKMYGAVVGNTEAKLY